MRTEARVEEVDGVWFAYCPLCSDRRKGATRKEATGRHHRHATRAHKAQTDQAGTGSACSSAIGSIPRNIGRGGTPAGEGQ